ncbi:hypothetical protein G7076_06385 [Sphingomonas sp. HDW15A]|uniref:hypothetical protein n=1 Tax=Sphingomonas sp. HDW15A TaxID=2714942 RepID=UPI00140CF22D|nr:hypothetical protein [Sphingomonas sp. HDW15A]QIK96125.1 hypothetical protein G7076_06385 [Sphingomonas sp. HDW15A]
MAIDGANSLRAGALFCQGAAMPKRKSLTPAEQAEKFRLAAKKRTDAGMPSVADADDAMDAKIAKNIRDYGA